MLGVGSPKQEKASGTASYSLALPIERTTFIVSKIVVATLEVFFLSLSMAFIIPLASILFGFHYPIKDAFFFSLLLSSAGLIFMLVGFLLSLLITSELVSIPLGMSILAIIFFVSRLPAFEHFNIFNFMTGTGYLSNESFLFNQTINFFGISIMFLLYLIGGTISALIFKKMDI